MIPGGSMTLSQGRDKEKAVKKKKEERRERGEKMLP